MGAEHVIWSCLWSLRQISAAGLPQVLSTKTAPHKSEVKRQKQNSHQRVGDKEEDDVTAKTTVYKPTLNKVHNGRFQTSKALKLQVLIKIIT